MTYIALIIWLFVPISSLAAQIDLRLQDELDVAAPDETIPVIIRLSEQLDPSVYKHLPKKEHRRQLVRDLRATSGRSQKGLRKLLKQAGAGRIKDLWHINALALDIDPTLIKVIASRPEVAVVSLDGLVVAPSAQPAAVASAEWNLNAIGVLDLWPLLPGPPGDGQVVAMIDTGADASHPNLQNWRGGLYDWFDPTDPGNTTDTPVDTTGHGTAVMGLMAGSNFGGTQIGIAPGSFWIAANPFATGTATESDLHDSFAWALDPNGDQNSEDIAPDVVNNSWALNAIGICHSTFQADINLLKGARIGVVFAAGNSGSDLFTSQSPGNNPNVVAVGATDPSGEVAWFSSRGSSPCDGGSVFPELVAPGVDIRTTLPGGYGTVAGTSFSAPHVAGVMALLMQAYPSATVTDIETAMIDSAVDLGPAGPDPAYGYGQVHAMLSWRNLAGEPILSIHDPATPANDHHLDFGPITPETTQIQDLTLRNAGSSDLLISTIDFSGLTTEIALESDSCSNLSLSAGQSCRVSLSYSPPDFTSHVASLVIPSNDPVDASVSVTLTGAGNTAPPAASLLEPMNGAVNVAIPARFSWSQTADSDGDMISTALLVSLTPDFSQSTPIVVTSVLADNNSVLYASGGLLILVAALLRRKQRRMFFFGLTLVLLLSCGGAGGGSGGVVGEVVTYDHPGLIPATSYYWTVQSTDARGAMTESVVHMFTTSL